MLITSNQLSARHKLKDEQLEICCNNTELERVTEWKLLGLTIDLKSNIEQPYIKNAKKLLFALKHSKKTRTIKLTDRAQTVSRIVNLFKTRLL